MNGETELKLSHLTSVKQKIHEGVAEYIRRFRDIRNRCYSLTISDRDLADLAFAGLLNFHKEKLDGQKFLDVSQVLQKALANKSRAKEALQKSNGKSNRPIYVLGCESNCSDDEDNNVYAAEFAWPSNNKSCTRGSLKLIQKNRQDNIKFTFDVSKYDRIFDELNKLGYIKLSHAILPLEELKRMLIANGIILSLMQPMIAMCLEGKFHRPLMKNDWMFHKYKLITILSLCILLNYIILRF